MALPPGRRATRSPLPLPLGVGLWANKWVIKGLQESMLECIGVLVGMGVNNHGGPFFGKFLSLRVKNYAYIVGPYILVPAYGESPEVSLRHIRIAGMVLFW